MKELGMVRRTLGIWNREELEEALKRVLCRMRGVRTICGVCGMMVVMMEETEGSSLSPEQWLASAYSPGLDIELEGGN